MKKNKLHIISPAREDINQIADHHLLKVDPISAERTTDKLLDNIEKLSKTPYIGSVHSDSVLGGMGYRKLICGEYVVVYRIVNDDIFVYRVFHGSSDYPKTLK